MDTRRRFWSENEAAQLCGVPYWKLKYLRDVGRINPLRIGRALAYSETDVKIAKMLLGDRNHINTDNTQCGEGGVK